MIKKSEGGGGGETPSPPSRKNSSLITEVAPAEAVEGKKNKYRGSFPAMFSLLPLVMSCGEAGSEVYTLMKELAIKRAEHRSEIHPNESRHLTGGAKVMESH